MKMDEKACPDCGAMLHIGIAEIIAEIDEDYIIQKNEKMLSLVCNKCGLVI